MSDRSNFLGDIAKKMKEGIARINEEAQAQAARKAGKSTETADDGIAADAQASEQQTSSSAQVDDLIVEEVFASEQSGTKGTKQHSQQQNNDEFEEGLVIDAEPVHVATAKKQFDKKKVLVVGALIVAGVVFMTSQDDNLTPEQIISQTTSGFVADGGSSEIEEDALNINGFSSSEDSDDAGMFGDFAEADPVNGNMMFDSNMPEEAYSPQAESVVLDPFTGLIADDSNAAFELQADITEASPFGDFQDSGLNDAAHATNAPKPAQTLETQEIALNDGLDDLMLNTDESPLISAFESNDTKSSSDVKAEKAIKNGELHDQVPNADVANLKAEMALKDERIRKLEAEAAEQAKALAQEKSKAKAAEEASKKLLAQKAAPKSQPAPAAQQRPAPQPQRAAPQQRQATTRPQICISAIAQAARNCTTCVPHAFIVHKGQESMVGHGDFLEGLRVNIVGDRLDLQDSQGRVVHKFWSSPNACSAS